MRRLEVGQPPTDDCEKEWDRIQRDNERREEENVSNAYDVKILREQRKLIQIAPPFTIKTTALPRPNSYIPPDIGN